MKFNKKRSSQVIMKRFKFNLESVLKYRESIERQEKGVLSGLNAQLMKLLDELEKLNNDYMAEAAEFERMTSEGITVHEVKSKHTIMENIEYYIEKKLEEIEAQQRRISVQTSIVVKAMRDTKTMDRLKEIRHEEYIKEENKENELFIEEFVSQKAAAAAAHR